MISFVNQFIEKKTPQFSFFERKTLETTKRVSNELDRVESSLKSGAYKENLKARALCVSVSAFDSLAAVYQAISAGVNLMLWVSNQSVKVISLSFLSLDNYIGDTVTLKKVYGHAIKSSQHAFAAATSPLLGLGSPKLVIDLHKKLNLQKTQNDSSLLTYLNNPRTQKLAMLCVTALTIGGIYYLYSRYLPSPGVRTEPKPNPVKPNDVIEEEINQEEVNKERNKENPPTKIVEDSLRVIHPINGTTNGTSTLNDIEEGAGFFPSFNPISLISSIFNTVAVPAIKDSAFAPINLAFSVFNLGTSVLYTLWSTGRLYYNPLAFALGSLYFLKKQGVSKKEVMTLNPSELKNYFNTGDRDIINLLQNLKKHAIYEYRSEIWERPTQYLDILALPFHMLAGLLMLPSSRIAQRMDSNYLGVEDEVRSRSNVWEDKNDYRFKRETILVDGKAVDILMLVHQDNLAHPDGLETWGVMSGGNGVHMHYLIDGLSEMYSINEKIKKKSAKGLRPNWVFFDYPGVMGSDGLPTCDRMVAAYKGVVKFVTDKQKGLGAKKLIPWGTSIGGGVQGEFFNSNPTKIIPEDCEVVCVKQETFQSMRAEVAGLIHWTVGSLISFIGWNFNSLKSSKTLKHHEIVIQCAPTISPTKKTFDKSSENNGMTSKAIKDDGVIMETGSLAYGLLHTNEKDAVYPNKTFIGKVSQHCANLKKEEIEAIADKIVNVLKI